MFEKATLETGPYLWRVLDAMARGEAPEPAPGYSYEHRLDVAKKFFQRASEQEVHYDLLSTQPESVRGDATASKRFRVMQLYAQPHCQGWAEIARTVGLSVERVRQIALKQFRIWSHPSFFGEYCTFHPLLELKHRYRLYLKRLDRVGDEGDWQVDILDQLTFPEVVQQVNAHLAPMGGRVTMRFKAVRRYLHLSGSNEPTPVVRIARGTRWYIDQCTKGVAVTSLAKQTRYPLEQVTEWFKTAFKKQQPYAMLVGMPYIVEQGGYRVLDRHGKTLHTAGQLTAALRYLTQELRSRDIDPGLYWNQEYTTPWPF